MKTSSTTTITITLLDWARLPSLTQMLATATATVLLERDLSQGSKVVGASIVVLAANSNLAHGIRCCRRSQPLRLIFMCTDFCVPARRRRHRWAAGFVWWWCWRERSECVGTCIERKRGRKLNFPPKFKFGIRAKTPNCGFAG